MYVGDEQECKVSGILLHKGSGGRRKCLVVYSVYNEPKARWLPESERCNALEILNNYKVSHGLIQYLTMVYHLCIILLASLWIDVKLPQSTPSYIQPL